jgi:hypothetical protein
VARTSVSSRVIVEADYIVVTRLLSTKTGCFRVLS